jgi:hypothetical protein
MKATKRPIESMGYVDTVISYQKTYEDNGGAEELSNLHRKLQEAKQQRKKVEMEAKLLEHRVLVLQNQERVVSEYSCKL